MKSMYNQKQLQVKNDLNQECACSSANIKKLAESDTGSRKLIFSCIYI